MGGRGRRGGGELLLCGSSALERREKEVDAHVTTRHLHTCVLATLVAAVWGSGLAGGSASL